MRLYRAAWRTVCAAFAGLGAVVGLALPAPVLVLGAILVQVLGGIGYLAVQQHRRPPRPGSLRGLLCCGLGCAVGVLVLAGLLRTLGVTAVPLLAVLAAGHPRLLARHTRNAEPDPMPQHPGPDRHRPARRQPGLPVAGQPAAADPAVTAEQALRALSTAELCRQWQRSYFALQPPADAGRHAGLALLRQGYLDELERRDPAGVAAWLAAGPRAGADPRRHFAPDAARRDRT